MKKRDWVDAKFEVIRGPRSQRRPSGAEWNVPPPAYGSWHWSIQIAYWIMLAAALFGLILAGRFVIHPLMVGLVQAFWPHVCPPNASQLLCRL